MARLDGEIARRLAPVEETVEQLDAITGIGRLTGGSAAGGDRRGHVALSEPRHLASWAGLCPGQNESAGHQAQWADTQRLALATHRAGGGSASAGRTQTYLGALYRRLATRRGPRRAAIAVAHAIVVTIYHMLSKQTDYKDLGGDYFATRQQASREAALVRRLERLGYEVALRPRAS